MIDIKKVNLDAPAFGEGSQKIEDIEETKDAPAADAEAKKEEEIEEGGEKKEEEKSEGDSEEEPARVKYSRFKNVHSRAVEAEKLAEKYRLEAEAERAKANRREPADEENKSEVPDYWKRLYGNEESENWSQVQEAWRIQRQHDESVKKEAREEAIKAIREERTEEKRRTEENISFIDENFDSLSALVGRDLTDKEQSAVLDIVDDYTPKDEEGNYLGAVIPFEKAWEIYELKQAAGKAPKQKSRDAVASLSGSKTEGETTITEKDKNFNPQWGALDAAIRARIGQ